MLKDIGSGIMLVCILALLIGLMVTRSKTEFKRGDCFQSKTAEVWENPKVCQILLVGKRKYLYRCPSPIEFNFPEISFDKDALPIEDLEANFFRVECPESYKETL